MRLTERIKDENGIEHIFTKYVKDNQKLKDEKLCQLEDIEDELGIDLIALFKAMKNGFWCVDSLSQLSQEIGANTTDLSILDKELKVYDEDGWVYAEFYLKDYGKTWALTREELIK